jgi:hypothetical protein
MYIYDIEQNFLTIFFLLLPVLLPAATSLSVPALFSLLASICASTLATLLTAT